MIVRLKFNEARMVDGFTIEMKTDCETFRAMLDEHSPNLLIDYLNTRYGTNLPLVANPHKKEGGCHSTL